MNPMSKWKTTDTENRQLTASFCYHFSFSFSHGTNAGETRVTKMQQQNSKMLRQGPKREGRGLGSAGQWDQERMQNTESNWKKRTASGHWNKVSGIEIIKGRLATTRSAQKQKRNLPLRTARSHVNPINSPLLLLWLKDPPNVSIPQAIHACIWRSPTIAIGNSSNPQGWSHWDKN